MHDIDAIIARQRIVTVANRIKCAESPNVEIGEEAGVIAPRRLDKGHIDGPLGILGNVARRCRAARTATNHDGSRFAGTK